MAQDLLGTLQGRHKTYCERCRVGTKRTENPIRMVGLSGDFIVMDLLETLWRWYRTYWELYRDSTGPTGNSNRDGTGPTGDSIET
eukprot:7257031-Pyramimonas_sp.AAC.1